MSRTAADIMTTKVVTARPDATVAEIAKLLADNDISAVPVCDDKGSLLGMLSEGDLLQQVGKDAITKRACSTCWRRDPVLPLNSSNRSPSRTSVSTI